MTTLQGAVIGDIGDERLYQLGGIDNLDAVTSVEAHVWRSGNKATLTAAVTDTAECTVTVQLGETVEGWLTAGAVVGTYNFEIEATFTDGSVRTWPNSKPDLLPVRAQGD